MKDIKKRIVSSYGESGKRLEHLITRLEAEETNPTNGFTKM